jgi:hypothetical protein
MLSLGSGMDAVIAVTKQRIAGNGKVTGVFIAAFLIDSFYPGLGSVLSSSHYHHEDTSLRRVAS